MVGVRLPTHNTLKTTTMTKENFINKWAYVYNVNDTTNPYFVSDLEAVIATEIAKVQEKPQPEELKGNCSTFDMSRLVNQEYKPAEQPAKPFDKERFERMFCAVVASGEGNLWSSVFDITNQALKQLDAFYASKEGGNNG